MKPLSFIDVGCGVGTWLCRIGSTYQNAHGVGVDIIPEFIVKAEQLANKLEINNRISFEVGDGTNLRFDDKTFDIAICLHDVLNNCLDYSKIVSELHRVSKWRVIISVHSIRAPKTTYVASIAGMSDFEQVGDLCSFVDSEGRRQYLASHLFTARELREIVSQYSEEVLDLFGVDLLGSRFAMTSGTCVPEKLKILEHVLRRDPEIIDDYQHLIIISKPRNERRMSSLRPGIIPS